MDDLRTALEDDLSASAVSALLQRPDVLSQLRGNESAAWQILLDALKRSREVDGSKGRMDVLLQVSHTPLHLALTAQLLAVDAFKLDMSDFNGRTLLHEASLQGARL